MTHAFALPLLGALLTGSAHAQCEVQRVGAPSPEFLDVFGYSIAIEGTTAVFGSIGADDVCPLDPNCDSGSAFVFEESGGSWSITGELRAGDAAQGDQFGQDVAISGDRVIVGAHLRVEGAAYVFRRSGNSWVEEQKLTGSDSQPFFHFGHSVAIDGDTIVVGVMRDTHAGNEAGSAFVFRRVGGAWVELAKLTASDAGPDARFGRSCDVDGDVIVIGAHVHDVGGIDAGAAYVYERDDNGTPNDPLDDTWPEVARLDRGPAVAGALFGRSVAVDGDLMAIGCSKDRFGIDLTGSVYVYERIAGTWTQGERLIASDAAADDSFGESVAIDGERILVGSVFDDDQGNASGSAYVFERAAQGWIETAKLLASDGAAGAVLGAENAVSLSGTTALLSAPLASSFAQAGGAGYLIDLRGCLGETYCQTVPNSTGSAGALEATGSPVASRHDLALEASDLPMNSFGLFLVSRTSGLISAPGVSVGDLCLGNNIGRYVNDIFNSGTAGSASLNVDLLQVPTPFGPFHAVAGDTLYFQAWHRDSSGGVAIANTTNAVELLLR